LAQALLEARLITKLLRSCRLGFGLSWVATFAIAFVVGQTFFDRCFAALGKAAGITAGWVLRTSAFILFFIISL